MSEDIIGHGTWYDKTAVELVERERKLGRSLELIRTESGLGASGLPHIGSFADCARAYAVTLALEEQGYNSEYIAFADDKDGLRKVPAGLPESLEKYLGYPVSAIPDPYDCHQSYGEHMTYLLLDALNQAGIEYTYLSGFQLYKNGAFNEEIKTILLQAERVGEIIRDEVGQEKYVEALPYFPVCSSCGRIYTTKAHDFLPEENRILYTCEGMEVKGKWLEGCGYEGAADYTKGEGKLSWKSEFAARWKALDIRFEAYGKDIADSVRINDRICEEVLNYPSPLHVQYEMFLDKSGRKISKSAGNVFTPQVWFRYGSPESLLLLTLKRFVGARALSVTDIPQYMNELDELENVYFGRKKITNRKERAKLRGLYQYCQLQNPPSEPSVHVPYNLLTYLAKVAPEGSEREFIVDKLQEYGYVEQGVPEELEKRIGYALNWIEDFMEIKERPIELNEKEASAIEELIQTLKVEEQEEQVQSVVFDIARKHDITPGRFFKTLYKILIGVPRGPRFGPYVIAMGRENVIAALQSAVEKS
ncbi:lysine--tRNA ligase [Candidatus Bathyarchaeota archaeon]|nr:lysine--tRNA ligase [Candidatus Bathyarchaeota archaeon]NIR15362.1 lysine--tRNA ligase [Desulfobacterales bacterium]NIU81830.1 lysine--tRNA ligase [Candidatus Bathyarchaeota archaeon]NIV68482.1 lysine--tRNA ligase [Candidatus Bathyarchaeota archaeon]NIW16761.1 lysine--tRNA ligase [Candidatus Bathyarchaeota archaeon]